MLPLEFFAQPVQPDAGALEGIAGEVGDLDAVSRIGAGDVEGSLGDFPSGGVGVVGAAAVVAIPLRLCGRLLECLSRRVPVSVEFL